MRMRAKDSFHASDIGMLHAGAEFEVGAARGKDFLARGLAEEVAEPADAEEAEAPATDGKSRKAKKA